MSSVRDRIRNLQQSADPQPTKSVAERAKAVERVSEPGAELPKSLSQLKQKFDEDVTGESGSGLGARVARFDSDAPQSLKDRVRRLESGASDTGSLSARASAFEHQGKGVEEVAGQFSEQEKRSDDHDTGVRKARAVFEAGSKNTSVETTLSNLKISENESKNVDIGKDSVKTAPTKPSEPKPPPSTTTSQAAVAEGVSRRAAIFEHAESESTSNVGRLPRPREAPKAQPSVQPAQRGEASEAGSAKAKVAQEKSLRDELREVKRANEELVSMLLELTSAFRRLEGTRDELQKRIAELEKK